MTLDNVAFDPRYFTDNEFKIKYINLLNKALADDYDFGEYPESHHILPRAFFKLLGIKSYNSKRVDAEVNKDNLIKLSIKDHILAHYYLALFSSNELRKSTCYSFLAMVDRDAAKLLPSEVEFFSLLPELAQLRIERNQTISKRNKGRKAWNSGLTKETSAVVAEYTKNTKATKAAASADSKVVKAYEARCGKTWVSKDCVNKLIAKDELAFYLAQGWLNKFYVSDKGLEAHREANKSNTGSTGKVWINNAVENKMIDRADLTTFLANGWERGRKPANINQEVKKKNDKEHSKRMKNKKHIHNKATGECIRVDAKQIDKYLAEGWTLGNPKIAENNRNRSVNLKGKIYVNNGLKSLLIEKEKLDIYLNDGWLLGKKKKNT